MKSLLAILSLACATGCTSTYYRHTRDITEVYRISVLQGVDMRCTARPSGEIVLERYINDGGGSQAGAVIGGAVKAGGYEL